MRRGAGGERESVANPSLGLERVFSFSFVIQLFVGGAALPVPIVASWHRLVLSANVVLVAHGNIDYAAILLNWGCE